MGTITGTLVGSLAVSAVGAVAGGAAASLIFSGAGALGYIESDSKGERTVGAELSQNIMDVTAQKSSSIRSLRSTIVVEDNQSEQVSASTFNITNYNHAHALTIQYYELLQHYRVTLVADAVEPFVIVPLRPLDFSIDLISDYWDILRRAVPAALREPIDQMYATAGLIALPPEPVSQSAAARLSRVQVKLSFPTTGIGTPPKISVVVKGVGGTNDQELVYARVGIVNPFDFSDANVVVAEKVFDGDSGPLLADLRGIRIESQSVSQETRFRMSVTQTEIKGPSGRATLASRSLGPYTAPAGAGALDHVFEWKPKLDLQATEQAANSEFVLINRLLRLLQQRKYFLPDCC